jgi:hypothetical protein
MGLLAKNRHYTQNARNRDSESNGLVKTVDFRLARHPPTLRNLPLGSSRTRVLLATARSCQELAGNFGAREVEIVSEYGSIAEGDGIER